MSREHDELPLPDYDHVLVGHLPSRIASLEQADVEKLLDYEKTHGRRMPVRLVLERRIEALKSGEAKPTEGTGDDASGSVGGVGHGSKVHGTSRKAGGASRATLKVNPGGR